MNINVRVFQLLGKLTTVCKGIRHCRESTAVTQSCELLEGQVARFPEHVHWRIGHPGDVFQPESSDHEAQEVT